MSLRTIRAEVHFSGRVRIEVDADKYPHYFEDAALRGGAKQLIEDVFFDAAELTGAPFEDGSCDFDRAIFDITEGGDEER